MDNKFVQLNQKLNTLSALLDKVGVVGSENVGMLFKAMRVLEDIKSTCIQCSYEKDAPAKNNDEQSK